MATATGIVDRGLQVRTSPYWPHPPSAPQFVYLSLPHEEALYGGAAGGGKLLRVDEPIPTPDGWQQLGDLRPGDAVFDEHGQPCNVLAVSALEPEPEAIRLTFDDGTSIECCADHRWLTFDAVEMARLTRSDPAWRARRRAARPSRATGRRSDAFTNAISARNTALATSGPPPAGTVRTTQEIADTLLTSAGRRNHAVPIAGALVLPDADLPLDPYLFGVWLGDGTTMAGSVTTADAEIVQAFIDDGFLLGPVHMPNRSAPTYALQGLRAVLKALGVLGFKHIPMQYLRASRAQRLELLRGLMDADGTVAKHSGAAEFCTTKRELGIAVAELIASLGWKVRMREGRAKLKGRDCGPKWTMKWMPSEIVFRLTRKAQLQKVGTRRTLRYRYIVHAEPCAASPMRCIAVDSPSHLYLAGRAMVPTHNSDALLMAALQYVDIPGYAAIIIRRSFTQLTQPDALIPRSHEWLDGTDARWNDQLHEWKFPSGAVLKFGFLDSLRDLDNYQGPAYQFIGWDELTQFRLQDYTLVSFSRNRRRADVRVPVRVRSASNPGGRSHDAVRERFGLYRPDNAPTGPMICQTRAWQDEHPGRVFIPARVADNPGLDVEDYTRRMATNLDHHTRRQLLEGDWDSRPPGDLFRREWFEIVDTVPDGCRWVRWWDLAATEPSDANPDPDWTAGLRLGKHPNGTYFVEDLAHLRARPEGVKAAVRGCADRDGLSTVVWLAQDPGQAGKSQVSSFIQDEHLQRYAVRARPESGSKFVRARPVSAKAEHGLIKLKRAPWNIAFLDEHEAFTETDEHSHDDIVDALSSAFGVLASSGSASTQSRLPNGSGPTVRRKSLVFEGERYVDRK